MQITSSQPRWCPRSTVAAIVERNGRFLLVEETIKGRKLLNQPAGHLEPDERFTAAVMRETLEETGWHVRPTALLGLYVYLPADRSLTFHRVTYVAEAVSFDEHAVLDEAIDRVLWLTRDEVAERADRLRSNLVLDCIDDYLKGVRYPLEFINDSAVDL